MLCMFQEKKVLKNFSKHIIGSSIFATDQLSVYMFYMYNKISGSGIFLYSGKLKIV